ncbi:MAG TPA: 2-hydroxychromene-2-carboxylate isomerase [Candidatus Limnocylindrales bacterium]|nr:2-hydroxychromene-2-carboxylate isomerase [Candidatus Limnocylindrales bacterium]
MADESGRPRLEFFYDCSSPWTYLAFTRIEDVASAAGAELIWRPILVGGIFNTINDSVYEQRKNPVWPKMRYYAKDLQDWAALYRIRIGQPPVFPVNSVKAMRGAFVAQENGRISEYSRKVFEAYWGDLRDISRDDVLEEVAEAVGLDRGEFFGKIAAPEYKERLRANTDELIERGGFGSPTMFIDGADMYFGNDRLVLVEHALMRRRNKEFS